MAGKIFLCLGLVTVFLGLRLYKLKERLNFSMDQGIFMLEAKDVWENKKLTLLGPTASPTIDGRHFFQGPIIYYSLAVMGVIGNWDPLLVSQEMVVLALIGTGLMFEALRKVAGNRAGLYGAAMMTTLPPMIKFSNFIWNPNFLMLITPLFLWTAVNGWWLIAGIVAGVGLQFHFQFGLVILLALGWIIIKTKKSIFRFVVGLTLGYCPLIIFDMRNDFYNSRTFLKWLLSGKGEVVGWQTHYFIAIIIVGVFWGAIWMSKKRTALVVGLLVMIWSLFKIDWGGVGQNLSYVDLLKTEAMIVQEKPKDFNVAILTAGDTRFYALRYLLTKDGLKVEAVDKYPESRTIYVVSDKPPEEFLKNPVWEVSHLKLEDRVNKREINHKVNLFKFEKT